MSEKKSGLNLVPKKVIDYRPDIKEIHEGYFKILEIKKEGPIKDLQHSVSSVKFSPDGKLLASGDSGGNLVLRNVSSRKIMKTFKMEGDITGMAWLKNGEYLIASNTEGKSILIDVASQKIIKIPELENLNCGIELKSTPDGKFLLAVGETTHACFYVTNLVSFKKFIVTLDDNQLVNVYDVDKVDNANVERFEKSNVSSLDVSPSGLEIVIGFENGTLRKLSFSSSSEELDIKSLLKPINLKEPIRRIKWSINNRYIAVGTGKGTIHLLDPEKWKQIKKIVIGKKDAILGLAWSPDAYWLAACSSFKYYKVFQSGTFSEVYSEPCEDACLELDWSSDGKHVYSGLGNTIIKTWKMLEILDYQKMHGIAKDEFAALRELELSIERVIPIVQMVGPGILGVMIEKKRIIGLGLANRKITGLPDNIGNLKYLEIMELSDNKITGLPDSFKELRLMRRLNLSNNPLKSVPDVIRSLKLLDKLFLTNCGIGSIPEWVKSFNELTQLSLSSNKIRELPKALGKTINLNTLMLNDNMLTELPSSLSGLKKLKQLFIKNNKISELPKQLKKLEENEIIQGLDSQSKN